jgi:hypothetical protein
MGLVLALFSVVSQAAGWLAEQLYEAVGVLCNLLISLAEFIREGFQEWAEMFGAWCLDAFQTVVSGFIDFWAAQGVTFDLSGLVTSVHAVLAQVSGINWVIPIYTMGQIWAAFWTVRLVIRAARFIYGLIWATG